MRKRLSAEKNSQNCLRIRQSYAQSTFFMKNVLAHKTSKRKRKSIPQKHNKNNGKAKEIQRASILEPQNKQREPATQISTILILTQATQHFSIQVRVRRWHRKALRNALPISQKILQEQVNH